MSILVEKVEELNRNVAKVSIAVEKIKKPVFKKLETPTIYAFTVDEIKGNEIDIYSGNATENMLKFVKDWFMKKAGKLRKFDVVVSNPPYQVDVAKKDKDHGIRNSIDVFPFFQKVANILANQTALIYPATWQNNINSKSSLFKYLVKNNLRSVDNYEGSDIFGNAIKKGYVVNVVYCAETDTNKQQFYVNVIQHKYNTKVLITNEKIEKMYEAIKDSKKLNIELKDYVGLSNLSEYKYDYSGVKTDKFDTALYIKKKPGKQADAKTVFVGKEISKYVRNKGLLDKYNVSIQSAPIGRQSIFNAEIFNKKTWNSKIFKPGETFGKTYMVVKSFDSLEEAENFSKYMNTEFFVLLSSLAYRKNGFANTVPDLVDYSNNNKDINWSEPLNEQLYKIFKLD